MKTLNIICRGCIFIVFGLSQSGCKKLIEIPDNAPNQIVTSQVFADSSSAVAGVMGLYVSQFNGVLPISGAIAIKAGMSADELLSTNPTDQPFYNNALTAGNGTNPFGSAGNLWADIYGSTFIYQANACVEGLSASTTLSTGLKNQLIGESEMFRDLAYYHLVNLYGGVPLVRTTVYTTNSTISRSPIDSIYAFLIHDLADAASRLKASYPSNGHVRPNKYAALALLSKIYLNRKQWALADQTASQVINSGIYSIEHNLDNVFLDGSVESIWQVLSSASYDPWQTYLGNALIPTDLNTLPQYYLSPNLIAAFEPNDQRYVHWIQSYTVGGQLYYYAYKYKNSDNGNNVQLNGTVEDYSIFRLSELYLIRAEARLEEGNLGGAASDLNIIRSRAGLPNTTATSTASLLAAIMHERQIELFCEDGNRWYDLKRWETANAVLSAEKPGIWPSDGHAVLYPISISEIRANHNLTQNPGY